VQAHLLAWDVTVALKSGDFGALQHRDAKMADHVRSLLAMRNGIGPEDMAAWYADVSSLAHSTIGALPSAQLTGVWIDPVWLSPRESLPTPAQAVLAAFDAAARRDVTQMRPRALNALDQLGQDPRAPDILREQMLVLAMLGAIGENKPDQVAALEHTWGDRIPPSTIYEPIRAYLQAWADLPQSLKR